MNVKCARKVLTHYWNLLIRINNNAKDALRGQKIVMVVAFYFKMDIGAHLYQVII
jgi:hypothetical protein